MLRGKGLTQTLTVPVSAGLLSNVTDYFAALDPYRRGEPTAIIEAFATASFRAISNGEVLVNELRDLRSSWTKTVTARTDSAVWDIADLLLKQPIIDGALASAEIGIAPNNALRSIDRLVASGVLTEITSYGRQRKWAAPAVLSALDDFAERADRRG